MKYASTIDRVDIMSDSVSNVLQQCARVIIAKELLMPMIGSAPMVATLQLTCMGTCIVDACGG